MYYIYIIYIPAFPPPGEGIICNIMYKLCFTSILFSIFAVFMYTVIQQMMRNRAKTYYVALRKGLNRIIISKTKAGISSFIGISVDTIRRRMDKSNIYGTDEFTIWGNVPIDNIIRGFAIHPIPTKWNLSH